MKDINSAFAEYKKNMIFEKKDIINNRINQFQELFPIDKLKSLKVEDYSLGYGDDTLCNWLEYITKDCGNTTGSYADKYYIFSKENLKANNLFKIKKSRKIITINKEEAEKEFLLLKNALLKLYELGLNNEFDKVDKVNMLWTIAKTKFLFMYFPDRLLPIMSSEHLKKICENLGFNYDSKKPILTNYKLFMELKKNPIFKNEHPNYIGGFFYYKNQFGLKKNYIENYNDVERTYLEGKEQIKTHISKERDYNLVRDAKKIFKSNNNGRLFCEVCGFDFKKEYGCEFIEGHHIVPIANLKEETKAKVKDIVMLCSNCHRMIHYYSKDRVLEIKELIKIKKGLINNPQVS